MACKIFGCSRPTYYRYKKAYLEGGEEALRDVSRKKPNPKNQVLPHKIKILLAMTKKFIIPPKILYYPTFYLLIQWIHIIIYNFQKNRDSASIDTYSKVAFAKLYVSKNAVVASDLLSDKVVPFFEENGLRVQRILTDRGSEYCGNIDRHEYQLFLANKGHQAYKNKAPKSANKRHLREIQ